jgi:hypothetical protein
VLQSETGVSDSYTREAVLLYTGRHSFASSDSTCETEFKNFNIVQTYLRSIAKQVLATDINHFLSPLPGTKQYWCQMRKHGSDLSRARIYDPWVERQTQKPLRDHSPLMYHFKV